MSWQPTVYSAVPAVAALATAGVFALAWHHRSRPIAVPFMTMLMGLTGWALAYAIQIGFDSAGAQELWSNVTATFGYTVPTLWLVVALYYSGRDGYLTRPVTGLLAAQPLAMIALIWTNSEHGLVWTINGLSRGPGPTVLDVTFQPLYLAHVAYSYLLILGGIALILDVYRRQSSVYRKQAGVLALGAAVPTVANVAFTLGLSPIPELDFTSFTFAVTAVLFGLALFEFDLLNLVPVARRNMLEDLDAGIVVLDEEDRVVEFNDVAGQVLDPAPTVGERPDASFPVALDELDGTVLETAVGGPVRYYDVRVSPIDDHRGRHVGRSVGLVDVTGIREREQRLAVANRLLRHNLRNSVSVIDGYAQRLEGQVEDGAQEDLVTVRDEALHLADLGEKAREMVRTLDHGPAERTPVDAVAAVEGAIESVGDVRPHAAVEADLPPDAWVDAVDSRSVQVAVENLLENAIQHNDSAEPWVRVSVSTAPGTGAADPSATAARENAPAATPNGGTAPDDFVRIRVEDDGPGIHDEEREVLARGAETPLRHGSGLGLWIVNWTVRTSGGDVTIEDRDPRGTAVTLSFPAADPPDTAGD
ncbi:hypothetical protein BRD00_03020 [Halobacteriales archaeon QS_8_69_26]|nr:MAG: hypothetical protein BRD00_03020 [Halobacteriales archaeon QS_8_69_26]